MVTMLAADWNAGGAIFTFLVAFATIRHQTDFWDQLSCVDVSHLDFVSGTLWRQVEAPDRGLDLVRLFREHLPLYCVRFLLGADVLSNKRHRLREVVESKCPAWFVKVSSLI